MFLYVLSATCFVVMFQAMKFRKLLSFTFKFCVIGSKNNESLILSFYSTKNCAIMFLC